MHARFTYEADSQGVRLFLTREEADEFCREVAAVDTAWEGPTGSTAGRVAMTVRGALDQLDKAIADGTAPTCSCVGFSHRDTCPEWVLPY